MGASVKLAALPTNRVFVLFVVAVAARFAAFGNPAVHADEQFYFTVAREMLHGAIPYVDIWDRKPLGLFLLFLPGAFLSLSAGVVTFQLIALACVVATAILVARLADLAGWRRGALFAGIAYILWLDVLNGVSGQSPVYYNLLVAGAAWLIASRPRRRAAGLVAMALVGCALQIKYSPLIEGVFFGLWLLRDEWKAGRSLPKLVGYGAALVAIALLPTALAFGIYVAIGHGNDWIFANMTSILLRGRDPTEWQLRYAGQLTLMLLPLIAMTIAGRGEARGGDPHVHRFALVWFGVALFSVAVFGGWYDHYGLPVALPGALASAGFMGGRGRRWTPLLLLLVACFGQYSVGKRRAGHGDSGQFSALRRAVGRGPGCLWVYSGDSLLYSASGRCVPTRFYFPPHLNLGRENGAIGVEQATEVRRILATRPAVIVMRPPFRDEERPIRAIVSAAVARDYVRVAEQPMGKEMLSVYRRRP